MDDAEEHALVVQALTDGLSNCVFWKERAAIRVSGDPSLKGYTPREIKRLLIESVRRGLEVSQVPETREGHRDLYKFYYKAILPLDDFRPRGLFVELVLFDDDPDCPMVQLVNAHPQ